MSIAAMSDPQDIFPEEFELKPFLTEERIRELVKDGENKFMIEYQQEIGNGPDMGDFKLCCPLCEFDYNHRHGPIVQIDGNDGYEACKQVRGSVVAIPFCCENEHQWVLCLGFHKGHQQVWTVCPEEDYQEWLAEQG